MQWGQSINLTTDPLALLRYRLINMDGLLTFANSAPCLANRIAIFTDYL